MITITEVSKKFGKKQVLQDISCQINTGQIYGLIGYNGAGKTTLLKIISGIYRPDYGQVCLAGKPILQANELKKKLFIMTEEVYFLPQADLQQMRSFYKGYYPNWDDHTFWRLIEAFGLNPWQKIHGFSKGMQRQVGLILAFSVRPQFLFLDEAFDGLDLVKRQWMKQLLDAYVEATNSTVVITSHNLRELEGIVDGLGMIRDSRLAFHGTVAEMRQNCQHVSFQTGDDQKAEYIKTLPWKQLEQQKRNFAGIWMGDATSLQKQLQAACCENIQMRPATLEEFFLTEKEQVHYDFQNLF